MNLPVSRRFGPRASIRSTIATALVAAVSTLAPSILPAAQKIRTPPETPGQPPAPPAKMPTATSPGRVSVVGTFTSVQMNVDANGNNIVGDAANEPSFAVSPRDACRIAVGWRQFDSISSNFRQAGLNVSFDGGATWGAATKFDPGIFRSDPVLAAAEDGTFLYSSLHVDNSGNFTTTIFRSLDGLASWQPGVFSYGGDKQWIVVDTRVGQQGYGNVYQSWDFATCPQCGSDEFDRSIDEGASWQAPVPLLHNPSYGTLAVAADGGLWIAGVPDTPADFGVSHSSNAKNSGVTPTFDRSVDLNLGGPLIDGGAPNPGGLGGQVWIAIDHSGGSRDGWIYVLASVVPAGSDPGDVVFIRSTDGGVTWSAPVRVNDDATNDGAWQWFGTMSVAPNGRIDVVWNDTRNHPASVTSELFYSFSNDGGVTWAPNVQVGQAFDPHVGWPQQNKIGDYYGMISDDTGADVIYAATYNGEQDVYFLRLGTPLSCAIFSDGFETDDTSRWSSTTN